MKQTFVSKKHPSRSIEVVRRALDEDDIDADPPEMQHDMDLIRAVEQLEGVQDATVRIYRQGMHGRDLIYIDEVPPANFTLNMLKHPPYNGGKFRIRVCDADGTFIKNPLIQVEPAPKAPEPVAAPLPVQQQGTSNEAFVLLAKAMTDGFSRIGELIVAARAEAPKPRTTQEILAELSAMKTLFDHPPAATAVALDPLDTVAKLLALVKDLPGAGGGDSEPGPMAVLLQLAKDFGPRLMAIHDETKALAAPVQPRVVPPHVKSPGMRVSPEPQPQPQRNPADMEFVIKQQLKLLVYAAQKDSDPDAYAVMVLDHVAPEMVDSFTKRPDWFAEICRYVPEAAPHAEWFGELRACIQDYLTGATPGEQTAGEPDNDEPANGTAAPGNTEPVTPNT